MKSEDEIRRLRDSIRTIKDHPVSPKVAATISYQICYNAAISADSHLSWVLGEAEWMTPAIAFTTAEAAKCKEEGNA